MIANTHPFVFFSPSASRVIINIGSLEIFENIQRLRKRYYQVYQGKQSLLDLISETEVGEQVYNSNAIENSTLTLGDTEKVLVIFNDYTGYNS
jgi:hypothetical protein